MLPVQSCECALSQLDLFQTVPTQISIENTQRIAFKPVSSIVDNQVIEFNIHSSPEHYTNLAETYLFLKVRVVNRDGANLTAAQSDKVAPINNWLHSLFTQVDLALNNTLVCSSNNYPYRAYIESLLNYDDGTKEAQLSACLWKKDSDLNLQDSPEGNSRGEYIKNSRDLEMIGRVHLDLMNQDKLLLNNVDMKLRFMRSKDEFNLLAEHDNNWMPKVQITEATLFMTRVKVSPTIQLAHAGALELSNARYFFRKTDVKTFSIQAGSLSANIDTAFLGTLPQTLVIGIVEHDSFNGSFQKSPFNFKHMNVTSLSLSVNGIRVPNEPLCPDFVNGNFINAFHTLFTGTGRALSKDSFGITRDNYARGFTLYAFDLTADEQGDQKDHINATQQGSLKIELKFRNALVHPANLIVYADFDTCIQIDRHRNVILES